MELVSGAFCGYLTIDVVTTLTQANFYDIYGGEVCLHTKITVAAL